MSAQARRVENKKLFFSRNASFRNTLQLNSRVFFPTDRQNSIENPLFIISIITALFCTHALQKTVK